MKALTRLLGVASIGVLPPAIAQPGPAQYSPSVQFTVQSISETRSTLRPGALTLTFATTSTGLSPVSIVLPARVTKAFDNADRDLLPDGPPLAQWDHTMLISQINTALRFAAASLKPSASSIFVTLRLPERDAKTIKLVEGEVEIYAPSETNGSVLLVSNALSRAGKPLADEPFKKNGVELIILTKENYPTLEPTIAPFLAKPPEFADNTLLFYVRDPDVKLGGYSVRDASGNLLPLTGNSTIPAASGFLNELRFGGPLPADIQVMFYFVTPEAMLKIPLRAENIPLL